VATKGLVGRYSCCGQPVGSTTWGAAPHLDQAVIAACHHKVTGRVSRQGVYVQPVGLGHLQCKGCSKEKNMTSLSVYASSTALQ
jgi:hypothetical protein